MNCRVVLSNWLERVHPGAITVSSEDTNYPASNLQLGNPAEMFLFEDLVNQTIDIDLSLLDNSYTEPGGEYLLTAWTDESTGTGSVELQNATEPRLEISAGASGVGKAQQRITVNVGEPLRVEAEGQIPSAETLSFYLYNPKTHKYLTSAGEWSATPQAWGSTTAAAYAELGVSFEVEPFEDVHNVTCELIATAETSDDVTAFVRNYVVIPAQLDTFSFHGLIIEPGLPLQIYSSENNFGAVSLEGTVDKAQPKCFLRLETPLVKRWIRISVVGTSETASGFGTIFVGQSETLETEPRLQENSSWSGTVSMPQIRHSTDTGEEWVYNLADYPTEELTIPFRDEYREKFREAKIFYQKTGFGKNQFVLIPNDEEPETYLGRLQSAIGYSAIGGSAFDRDLVFRESPLPTIVP